ncbi:MAG: sigma factor-like helix-turn-helix DNA-binding protein [bacterium]
MQRYLDIAKLEFKKHPDPIVLTREILKVLPERTKEVAVNRFGLLGDEPKTLEGIGRSYGITRERVRQIESSAFNKIKHLKADQQINPLADILETMIQAEGAVISESRLLNDILEFSTEAAELNKRAVRFILSLHDKFVKIKESDSLKSAWAIDKNQVEKAKSLINEFIKAFDSEKRVVPESELKQFILQKTDLTEEIESLSDDAIVSFIEISKNVGKNPFNQWGKKEWAEISPRGVRDKAYLVMSQCRQPMHFRKITEKINEVDFKNGKKAFSQTVHNELIKDDRFVLVGRGVYSLRNDESESDKVKKNIVEILKASNKPMSKGEIIEEILKKGDARRNTIAISLQDSKIFKKTKENKYTLCQSLQS